MDKLGAINVKKSQVLAGFLSSSENFTAVEDLQNEWIQMH